MAAIHLLVFLQVMDFLTTLIGLRLGAQEVNPIVRHFMGWGPAAGILIAKALAFAVGGFLVWLRGLRRDRVVTALNYIFAGVVLWNGLNLLLAVQGAVVPATG